MVVAIIWFCLVLLALWFIAVFARDYLRHRHNLEKVSWLKTTLIGFVVNFIDVLGIGSFAPQTALLKFTRQTEDRIIPGTLNVANTLPVLLQAIIFITIVEVEPLTLILMLVSAAGGALLGAGIVSKMSERKIRLTIGVALLTTAIFMTAGQLGWIPGGGDAIGLAGGKLILAITVNFILGALMTAGIGLYAPCMALVFALGMSPKVAFPIMMGSCAFLMPPASVRFIKEGAYNRKAALGMAIAGVIAVLIAAFIVKSLPIDALRWVVIGVVVYTAYIMLKAGVGSPENPMIP
ncbi:MAG TPA: sulfite exporter TauE/SafE family protein [Cyclobacteriaceae bacterium]|nr:sulfite exporter TauE/SafE family protein [Cyclobacteriaceae bacterium]